MTEKLLFTADKRGIATLTFNFPERRNAYDQEVLDGIAHHCRTLGADPEVRASFIEKRKPNWYVK